MTTELIHAKMVAIMADIGAVGKNQKNAGQGWEFRGIDDVMGALNPALIGHGVYIRPEVTGATYSQYATSRGGSMNHTALRVAFHFTASDGSSVAVVTQGEAADAGDKATSKALAIAMKYAVTQAFCVPVDQIDPDAEINEFRRGDQPLTPETRQRLVDAAGEMGYDGEALRALLKKGKRSVTQAEELFEGEAERLIDYIYKHPAEAK